MEKSYYEIKVDTISSFYRSLLPSQYSSAPSTVSESIGKTMYSVTSFYEADLEYSIAIFTLFRLVVRHSRNAIGENFKGDVQKAYHIATVDTIKLSLSKSEWNDLCLDLDAVAQMFSWNHNSFRQDQYIGPSDISKKYFEVVYLMQQEYYFQQWELKASPQTAWECTITYAEKFKHGHDMNYITAISVLPHLYFSHLKALEREINLSKKQLSLLEDTLNLYEKRRTGTAFAQYFLNEEEQERCQEDMDYMSQLLKSFKK